MIRKLSFHDGIIFLPLSRRLVIMELIGDVFGRRCGCSETAQRISISCVLFFTSLCMALFAYNIGFVINLLGGLSALFVFFFPGRYHYGDIIMGAIASQITSLTIVYSTVYSDAEQRKHQSSTSLAFVRGTHREPVNSPHKWPVTRKMFPFDDVIMYLWCYIG